MYTQERELDGGKIVESYTWRPHPTGARERDRARPLGVDRIGQQVDARDLNEKRGMTDERHDHVVGSDVGRPPRLDRDPRRPRGSWREQHARHHPGGLALRAARVEEAAAVKVISEQRSS